MMLRLIVVIILQLSVLQLNSQKAFQFHPPLKIPMYLSGNFGEIRDDHFHSGIDIKTGGVTGHPVHSIEEGYISRIKVQANGYGKSVYISHPTGHTSVYGHLDQYISRIALFVEDIQYRRRSHTVDIYLKPGQFPLKKGEVIGYSGNSGSSSGPHLHFEIRTTGDQHPTNVLQYGFDITDRMAPRFFRLFLYPISDSSQVAGSHQKFSCGTFSRNGNYALSYGSEITALGTIGCGVEVFDFLNGSPNRCGVYKLELFVNETPVYRHIMDEFAFSETRFINAHIDYGERVSSGGKVHRLYRLPNDRLRIYEVLDSDGRVRIEPDKVCDLRVVATDVAGNSSELIFRIRGAANPITTKKTSGQDVQYMPYHRVNRFVRDGVEVELPAFALYEDLDFRFKRTTVRENPPVEFYHIHSPETPVHLPYRLSVKTEDMGPGLNEKLCLVVYDNEGKPSHVGGAYHDGTVEAEVRQFGTFSVSPDTLAPEIIPLNGNISGDLSGEKTLRFTIRDDLSGIETYEGYIDNRWALFEYDPKNDLLTYTFDDQRIRQGSGHELELYVTDAKGNVNLFHTTFVW
ncbi:MAG: M23 family metallopeptidase [Bacteroidota bacterium]